MFRKGISTASKSVSNKWHSKLTPQRSYGMISAENMEVYVSNVTNPWINSSIERWIIEKNKSSKLALYVWRNEPVVIIGRNQNPYKECHLQKMEEDSVKLLRRHSGGGTVYHDLGNTNFSFICGNLLYDKNHNYDIIMQTLKKFEINAELKGRNDIVVNDKKISGSAYLRTRDMSVHHGTLLLDVNLTALPKYLNPNKKKLESKGIDSVRARVMNLKEICPVISHEVVTYTMIQEFLFHHREFYTNDFLEIDEEMVNSKLMTDPSFKKIHDRYKDWNWTFGQTPNFTYNVDNRFDWGCVSVGLESDSGVITDINIESDSLFPDMINLLNKNLKNQKYSKCGIDEGIRLCIEEINQVKFAEPIDVGQCVKNMREFGEWFTKTI